MMAVRVDALDKELADLHNQLAAEKKKQAKGSYRLAALRARLTAELAQQEAGREAEREQWEAERAQLEAQLAQLQAQNQPQKLVVTAGDFSGIVASVDVCPMAIYGPWSATPEQAVSVRVTTLLDALTAASQHTGSPLGQAVPLPGETQAPADAAEQGVPEEAQQGGAEGTSAEGGAASGVGSQDGPASEAASQDGAASGAASQGGTASGAASQGGQGTTLEGIAAGQGNSFAAMTGEGELDVELLAGFLLGGRVVDELLPGPEASGEGADSDGEE